MQRIDQREMIDTARYFVDSMILEVIDPRTFTNVGEEVIIDGITYRVGHIVNDVEHCVVNHYLVEV